MPRYGTGGLRAQKGAAGCYQQKNGRISLVLGHGVYLASKGGSWVKVKKRWRPWRAKCRRRRSPGSREEGKRQLGVVFGTEQRRRRAAAVVSPAARAMSGQSRSGRVVVVAATALVDSPIQRCHVAVLVLCIMSAGAVELPQAAAACPRYR